MWRKLQQSFFLLSVLGLPCMSWVTFVFMRSGEMNGNSLACNNNEWQVFASDSFSEIVCHADFRISVARLKLPEFIALFTPENSHVGQKGSWILMRESTVNQWRISFSPQKCQEQENSARNSRKTGPVPKPSLKPHFRPCSLVNFDLVFSPAPVLKGFICGENTV